MLEPSNPTTAGPEYLSVAEAQGQSLKIAFKTMIAVLKETYENTNSGKI